MAAAEAKKTSPPGMPPRALIGGRPRAPPKDGGANGTPPVAKADALDDDAAGGKIDALRPRLASKPPAGVGGRPRAPKGGGLNAAPTAAKADALRDEAAAENPAALRPRRGAADGEAADAAEAANALEDDDADALDASMPPMPSRAAEAAAGGGGAPAPPPPKPDANEKKDEDDDAPLPPPAPPRREGPTGYAGARGTTAAAAKRTCRARSDSRLRRRTCSSFFGILM
jgi:hypothetical protein